mmetsp:Transcript_23383/g.55303  ORF Transcript_23383/g.55303 Transcript_23383/m.55303 type:complete len:242 (+) Transcript_23383:892-1617(+)
MAPRILVKATSDSSAILLVFSISSCSTRQMTRKVSPLFLFGAPWYSSTTPWMISAMEFTKALIFDCNTSVAMLKSRTLHMPMMQLTMVPGTIALIMAEAWPFMLCRMMLAPASPKPKASSDPSFMMVFSSMSVSIGSSFVPKKLHEMMSFMTVKTLSLLSLFRLAFAISSCLNSLSAIFVAMRGSSRMDMTFLIIFSTGLTMSRFASYVNISDHSTRTTRRKSMSMSWRNACSFENGRSSK